MHELNSSPDAPLINSVEHKHHNVAYHRSQCAPYAPQLPHSRANSFFASSGAFCSDLPSSAIACSSCCCNLASSAAAANALLLRITPFASGISTFDVELNNFARIDGPLGP